MGANGIIKQGIGFRKALLHCEQMGDGWMVHPASKQKDSLKKLLCILITVVFVLSLIPMAWVARYDYPLGDDQVFGDAAAAAYRETGSIGAAMRAAADVVVYKFYSWQGTFSAMFLMALHPGVFGAEFYSITPYLMLASLILSTLFLAYVLLGKYLGTDFCTWWTIAITMLFFSIQLLPSAMEGFFWFNGAVYYTFFHSLFLTLSALMLLAWRTEKRLHKALYGLVCLLLAAILSGGNYATLLPCGVLVFFSIVYLLITKRKQDALLAGLVLVILLIGMGVSVLAPGNAVRQADVDTRYTPSGPVKAVLLSFAVAAAAVVNRFDTAAILIILFGAFLITPFLKQSKLKFRYPVLALLLAFCVFATQFTPTLYAATSPGPLRLRNIIFFNFYWMLLFDTVYITGWCIRRKEALNEEETVDCIALRLWHWLCVRPLVAVLSVALLTGAALLQRDFLSTTTVAAVYETYTGIAAAHGAARYEHYTGEPAPFAKDNRKPLVDEMSVLLP